MRTMLIGGVAAGLLIAGLALSSALRSGPTAVIPAKPKLAAIEAAAQPGHQPAVLLQVVEVTNIDALLDPPSIPRSDFAATGPELTRVGYEEPAPSQSTSGNSKPIPKAAE